MPSTAFGVDISGVLAMFKGLGSLSTSDLLRGSVGRAGRNTEATMRQQLFDLIYSTPESSGYMRTGRLFNGAHAAHPDADHSNDTDQALTGDLTARDDLSIVRVTNYVYETEIGDWVDYAWLVHEGRGQGTRPARPFSAQPQLEAELVLTSEVSSAIAAAFAMHVP